MKYILTNNITAIENNLKDLADLFAYNKAALTSEVKFSDRIFEMQKKYLHENFEGQTRMGGGNLAILYSMVTGDPGNDKKKSFIVNKFIHDPFFTNKGLHYT